MRRRGYITAEVTIGPGTRDQLRAELARLPEGLRMEAQVPFVRGNAPDYTVSFAARYPAGGETAWDPELTDLQLAIGEAVEELSVRLENAKLHVVERADEA